MLTKRSTAQTAWTMPAKRRTTSLPRVPDEPVVGHDNQAALTQAERRKAVNLIQKLLDMVDEGARPSVTPHTPCSGLCVQHPASSTAAPGLVESGGRSDQSARPSPAPECPWSARQGSQGGHTPLL